MRAVLGMMALALASAASGKSVVTADRYLDVNTGRYVEHPAIFVGDDGRISAIADARTVRWGNDVRHIDLAGRTLVPGLIDMHVHLGGHQQVKGYRALEYTDSFFVVMGVPNAKKLLDAGFITVRSLGAPEYLDVALRQGVELGAFEGPRIIAAT